MGTLTILQAAKAMGVTKNAIENAIKKGRLSAIRMRKKGTVVTHWIIDPADLQLYVKSKYDRVHSRISGELRFDPSKGEVSAPGAAKILGIPSQKVYHAIRAGQLKASRKRYSYIIAIEDLEAYRLNVLS